MNRPLGAPVNGHPIPYARCEPAPCQAPRVGRRSATGRGVWGGGGKRGRRWSRGVSPSQNFSTQPRNFFTPFKPRNPA